LLLFSFLDGLLESIDMSARGSPNATCTSKELGWWIEFVTPLQDAGKLTQGEWLQPCTPLRRHMGTIRRKCPCMVCANDTIWETIELLSLYGSTYTSRCNLDYPRCWSSSPNSSLSRTMRSRQPVAQWKREGICAKNWGSSSMGNSIGAKDSSIKSSELHLEGYHPKFARVATENWWRYGWWSRWPDLGWLWCGGLLVFRITLVESRT
jgi:hypothetical protein